MDLIFTVLIYLVVAGLIFYVAWWFIGYIGLPEPFAKIIRVLIGLAALIVVVYLLTALLPGVPHPR